MSVQKELEKIGFKTVDSPCCDNCNHSVWDVFERRHRCGNENISSKTRIKMNVTPATICNLYEKTKVIE